MLVPNADSGDIFDGSVISSDKTLIINEPTSCIASTLEPQLCISARYTIKVKVVNPEKVGEGISSYIVYTVKTTTNMPCFEKSSMSVLRRFSDFIGLYEKLKEKYVCKGLIIPSPPEKNVIETTKIRLSKSCSAESEFIEKRRISLECFMRRITNHPILVTDSDVRKFLEVEQELPRYPSGQSLSGVTAMKILKNVGNAVGRLTFKMDEVDEYFDLKEEELENWEVQSSRLFAALSNLVLDRNDLASSTLASSKAISILANVEEHTALARALGHLADTEEQVAHFRSIEAEAESTFLVEYSKGLLSMVQACRDTLAERVRIFKMHRDCESSLRGKREQKVRIEMSPKADRAKIPALEREIGELTQRVEENEEQFEKTSSTMKKEFEHVDAARYQEFSAAIVSWLTTSLQMQEKTLLVWEAFVGHAKAID